MIRCAIACLCVLWAGLTCAQTYTLSSPDLKLQVNIQNLGQLEFSLTLDDRLLIAKHTVGLELSDGKVLAKDAKIKTTKLTYHYDRISPEVRIKNELIREDYNELIITYKDGYDVVVRVYDNALAYRFVTALPDSLTIQKELLQLTIEGAAEGFFQPIQDQENFLNNYERLYEKKKFAQLTSPLTTQLPLLLSQANGYKLLYTEADLFDYPGLYLQAEAPSKLTGLWPAVVSATQMPPKPNAGWDRTAKPTQRYAYIARTAGTRAFPWRVMALSRQDQDLLGNEIVFKLSRPNALGDVSWIKPGKAAWDWWNDWNLTGVDFRAGVNTPTYKYFVDFAARNALSYVVLDEGWYELGDLSKPVAGLNLPELIAYAKQKSVGVILWASWKTLDDQLTATLDRWQQWGVSGIKVDFVDRDDQYAVAFYERCAAEAAKRRLIVDFHGASKPTGLQRTYPNILNFEGVLGLEQNKWAGQKANPDMAVTIPFIRMVAGPLDYTPGATHNAQRHEYAPSNSRPMSLGTRCHQLAMYLIYDAPLQMLADSPTRYEKEPETLRFLAEVPTVWDETVALKSSVGEYVAMARRQGKVWYVGAMTNWQSRELELDLGFLKAGKFMLENWQDGPNADRNANDFLKKSRQVAAGDKLKINLAPGGGWVGIFKGQ